MARVIGIDIPDNKRLIVSLTYIYGIGPKLSSNLNYRGAKSRSEHACKQTYRR